MAATGFLAGVKRTAERLKLLDTGGTAERLKLLDTGGTGGISDASTSDGRSYNKLLETATAGVSFPYLFGSEVTPVAYRCIVGLAQMTAGTPLVVCDYGMPFMQDRAYPISRLVKNPARVSNVSGGTFWQRVFLEFYGCARSLIHIRRRQNGEPWALENAQLAGWAAGGALNLAERVSITVPGRNGNILLNDVPQENIIVLADESWDPYFGRGEPPLECRIRNPVELTKALLRAYAYGTKQGGHQKTFFSGPRTKKEATDLHDLWKEYGSGVELAGMPFPLGHEGKVFGLSHSAEQQQLRQMLDYLSVETCRGMGMPPRFAYVNDGAGAKSGAGQKERGDGGLPDEHTRFLDHGFRARLDSIAGQLTNKLLPPNSRKEIVFDTDRLTLGTMHDKAVVAELLTARSPNMTPNESREYILGLPKIDDPKYDEIWPTKGAGMKEIASGSSPAPEPMAG